MLAAITSLFSRFGGLQSQVVSMVGGGGDDSQDSSGSCPMTKWDCFIEAVNRLFSPGLLVGTIAIFWWAAHEPKQFSEFARAIALIPDMGWYVIITIVSAWVVRRSIREYNKNSTSSVATATATTTTTSVMAAVKDTVKDFDPFAGSNSASANSVLAEWKKKNS